MQEYETLKRLVDEAVEDVSKAVGGNKAAGTRVRKKMQEIKAAAQDVRKKILEGRETDRAGRSCRINATSIKSGQKPRVSHPPLLASFFDR